MDHLRSLLKSLNKTERRYIDLRLRQSAPGNKDRGYQLLRALIDHPDMNDAELATFLKFNTSSALSTRKNDVLNRVLSALVDFDESQNEKIQFLKEIAVIRLLGIRGQYKLALKRLRKAESTAAKLDLYDFQLLLAIEERNMFYSIYPRAEWTDARERLTDQFHKSTEQIRNKHYYMERVMFINELNSGASARRTEERATKAKQLLEDPMLKGEQNAKSPVALYSYLTVHRLAAELSGDPQAELFFSKRLAELVLIKDRSPGRGLKARIMTLALYMDSHAHLGDPEDPFYAVCHKELETIRGSKKKKSQQEQYYLLVSHGSDVVIAIRAKQYKRAAKITKKAIEDIQNHPAVVQSLSRINLHFLFAAAYLLNKNWGKALDLLRPVLTVEKQTDRLDYYHLCMLAEVIIHFEMDHHQFVDSRVETLAAHFRKLDAPHQFERIFISYLGKINRAAKTQRGPLWKEFGKKLTAIRNDELEKVMFLTVDLLEHWVMPNMRSSEAANV